MHDRHEQRHGRPYLGPTTLDRHHHTGCWDQPGGGSLPRHALVGGTLTQGNQVGEAGAWIPLGGSRVPQGSPHVTPGRVAPQSPHGMHGAWGVVVPQILGLLLLLLLLLLHAGDLEMLQGVYWRHAAQPGHVLSGVGVHFARTPRHDPRGGPRKLWGERGVAARLPVAPGHAVAAMQLPWPGPAHLQGAGCEAWAECGCSYCSLLVGWV